jgi:hypothetical protein
VDVRRRRGTGTHDDINKWVYEHYGFRPDLSWIADCKELAGISIPDLLQRPRPKDRQCPPHKQAPIFDALRHFGLISQ